MLVTTFTDYKNKQVIADKMNQLNELIGAIENTSHSHFDGQYWNRNQDNEILSKYPYSPVFMTESKYSVNLINSKRKLYSTLLILYGKPEQFSTLLETEQNKVKKRYWFIHLIV